MKIRTQLGLLVLCMVLMPVLCVTALPLYHYITSPQRYLLKGYKEIRALSAVDFSEDDWKLLKEQLKRLPSHVQTIVCYESSILLSTMPELKAGTAITPLFLFDFIQSTSSNYDYQVQSPILQPHAAPSVSTVKFLIISRAKVPSMDKRHRRTNFYMPIYISFALFELVCIAFIINLSRTIMSSITLLEKNTMKIADGELDIQLETPKAAHKANEITSLTESLDKMRVSLKDDQERRTKFIMGISHDLRTPVALIKGYTEAITDGVVNDMDAVRKSLSIIHAKADQLEAMIDDLINYVKLNNTDWRQTLESVALAPVLNDFAQNAVGTAEVYKRTIDTSIAVSPETKVPMDRNLFNRALENILSNALRYTKDGDGISIRAEETQDAVTISIADSGIGIAKKDLEHIYDIFYRGTNSRREAGMGIGLSVVKTIIDTHGWNIDVSSELGTGTCFTITIPLTPKVGELHRTQ